MPIVTAAGYPTLVAPSTEAAPTPGSDYQQIQASPDAFGAGVGRAQSQLGDTFERASNQFEAVALEQQRLTNQVAASNADNYTMDEVQKILHGDPDKPGDVGYFGLKGDAALQARQPTMKAINDLLDRSRGSLSNPRQQLMFDQQTRRMRNYWIGQVGQHYDHQLNSAAAAAVDGSIKLAEQQQASSAANLDEVGFGLGVQREMEGVIKKAQNLGYGQEWVDSQFGNIRAKATSQWVQSMAVKDPLGADKYLEANKNELAFIPHEYDRLKNQIHTRAMAQQAQEDWYGVPAGQQRTDPNKIKGGLVRGGAIQGRVDRDQAYQLATKHGFQGQAADTMAAIIMAESGGDPNAIGDKDIGGSFGLTQINLRAHGEKAREALGNPDRALELAFDVSKGGTDFTPWTMYKNGQYRQYLGGVPRGAPDTIVTPTENVVLGQQKIAAGPGQVLRPLPPLEEGQLPDAQVPGLQEHIQELAKRLPPPDTFENRQRWDAAVARGRRDMNMAYSNQQHQHRIQQEADKASDQALARQYDMRIGRDPSLTSDEILHDPRWKTPEAAHTAVGFFERQTKPDPATAVSARNRREFFERIHLPDDDPNKVWSEKPFNDAYIRGDLKESDRKGLEEDFRKANSSTDQELAKHKSELLKRAKPKIMGLAAMGRPGEVEFIDPGAEDRFARYERLIENKIKEYRTGNKNPDDLFNPGKPADYLGRKEILEDPQFAPTMKQSLDDKKKPAAVAPLTLETAKTLADFQTLVRNNPGDREAIIGEAIRRGIVRPAAPRGEVPIR